MPSFRRSILVSVPAPWTLVLLGSAVMISGCAPTAAPPQTVATADHGHGHDHGTEGGHGHEHPTTLAAGLVELEKLLATVGEKIGADAKDAADDAVHAAGHLLEDLSGLLQKADLAADVKEAGTKALDELFACFDKLDTALHAGAGAKQSPAEVHASLEERLTAALAALKQHVVGGAPPESGGVTSPAAARENVDGGEPAGSKQ